MILRVRWNVDITANRMKGLKLASWFVTYFHAFLVIMYCIDSSLCKSVCHSDTQK